MSVITLEGIVEQGQIRLKRDIHLPDHTKVYIIVPETEIEGLARILSPRLARPEQIADFKMQIVEK